MKKTLFASNKHRFDGLVQGGGIKGALARGGIGSIAIKLGGTVLALLSGVFVARVLGPEQYGVYAYVGSLLAILSLPAQFGLPQLIVRETAKAEVQAQWGVMRGLWRWSSLITGAMAVVIALVSLIGISLFYERFTAVQLQTMYWGLLMLPLSVLGALRGAALRGLKKVIQGQLPDTILRPVFFLALIAVLGVLQIQLTAAYAMAMNAVASAIAFTVGAMMLWHGRPIALRKRPVVAIDARKWISSAFPLALTSALLLVNQNTDTLMIGWFGSASDVGIYRVAVNGGALVVFGLSSMNMVIGPYFAQFYAKKDFLRLQRLATTSARIVLLMTFPVVLAFLFFGKSLITMVFGGEYESAYTALAIISIGQLMNAGFGSVGLVLNMTGHEMETTRGVAVAALTNVVLNFLFIPLYGINGAAFATAITLFVWNVLLWIAVARRLGIDTLAIPLAKRFGIGHNW